MTVPQILLIKDQLRVRLRGVYNQIIRDVCPPEFVGPGRAVISS